MLTHGPVVGGVTASNANVFVRTDQAASVTLWYGTDPNLDLHQTSEPYQTDVSSDFTKTIPLLDLPAETTVYLNFLVNGVPQIAGPPYPYFTTFASSGAARNFKFVILADFLPTAQLTAPVQTFASAAAEQPAFVFIGGDVDHRNPKTLSAKRKMFKDLYDANTPFMGDFVNLILRKSPIVHQWDDHDSGVNNLDKTYPDWNLTQQVFQEYVPTYPLPSAKPGIWQRFSYAQLDYFVLDCRSQRDPETEPDDANKSMLDGNNLGATGELQWLENGLLTSTATWKIIFTSVVINPTTKPLDGWAGYQTEWNALRTFINSNDIEGVVFISGDLHLGAIDNGIHAGFPEMCVVPSNDSCTDAHPTSYFGTWSEGYLGSCRGYGRVTVLTDPDRLLLQAVDEFGTPQVSYTVVAGAPVPTPAPTPSPTLKPDFDLKISVTDGKKAAMAGASNTYTIGVNNSGLNDMTGALVSDDFPAEFTSVSFTATQTGGASGFTASGTGNIKDTVTIPAGASITYKATGKLSSSATGTLSNSAEVTAPSGVTDSNLANNSATDTDTITLKANLKVTVTDGKTAAVAGQRDTYTIVVTNFGPSDVTGAAVSDTFPNTFTAVTFTATQTGGASGFSPTGSGNINDTVTMPASAKITYKAKGTISPSASGTMSDTATVTPPSGVTDPILANNSANDTDAL